ncbi:ankyrin protein [Fusarium phyllophilum]|uniref:Ankyrin protein n=1 Tax=Fusarium phyllophilum TaxID=47803 RepID=A0A8H5JYB9_9HYPO|nr:ankyrin protein [Fusarium phyllophilum]
MFLKPSPNQPLASTNSHGILSKEPWRYTEPKATHGSSATAVNSSDDKVKDSLSTAMNDIDYPWTHHVPPIMLEPSFLDALDELLDKFKNQLILSNDGHLRAHGGHSHKTNSRRYGERNRKGQSTGQDSARPGSGGGGKDTKGKGTDPEPPPDGFRYPPSDEVKLPKVFGCPFYITDPIQFHKCSSCRLGRPSDVSQHIERCHLLQEVRLCTTRGEAAGRSGVEKGTCTDPNLIKFYDTTCRREFHGLTAEDKCRDHLAGGCYDSKTIEDTGILLPTELTTLKSERDKATGPVAKWYAMWRVCFLPTGFRAIPVSPYVQTIVSREQAEAVVRRALEPRVIPADYSLLLSQILNGIYLITYATDPEVQAAVTYQQGEEDDYALLNFNLSQATPGGHYV